MEQSKNHVQLLRICLVVLSVLVLLCVLTLVFLIPLHGIQMIMYGTVDWRQAQYEEEIGDYTENLRKMNARFAWQADNAFATSTINGKCASLNGQELRYGAVVTFGTYEQDNDEENGAEPMEWIVLGNMADGYGSVKPVLISARVLDVRRLNPSYEHTTWEASDLRAWLNGEFLQTAFTAKEQKNLVERVTSFDPAPISPDAPEYDFGESTRDSVWLLNQSEALQYFMNDGFRFSTDVFDPHFNEDELEKGGLVHLSHGDAAAAELTPYAEAAGEGFPFYGWPDANWKESLWYLNEHYLFSTNPLYTYPVNDISRPGVSASPREVKRNDIILVRPVIMVDPDN